MSRSNRPPSNAPRGTGSSRPPDHDRAEVLEHISDAFLALDEDWRVTYLNRRAETVLRRSQDELVGTSVWEAFPEAVDRPFYDHLHRAVARRTPVTFEAYLPTLDRWLRVHAHPFEGGLSVYFDDVTLHKKRRDRLRLLERAVMDVGEAVVITEAYPLDEPGPRIVYVNPAFTRMTGYAADEAVGRSPRFLQGPDTDRTVLDWVRRHLNAGEPLSRTTVVNYRKDGTPFWVEWTISPVRGPDGAVEHWVSVQRDVTEAHRQREALQEERQRLELAVIGGDLGLWDFDLDTGRIVVNDRWAEMLGYTKEEVGGEQAFFAARLHPDDVDRTCEAMEQHARGESPILDLEIRLRAKDETWRWIQDRGKIVERHDDGTPRRMVGTHMDVTERKRATEALRESRRLLQASQRIAHLGHWEWNVPAGTLQWSDEAFRIYGYEPGAITPTLDTYLQAIPERDQARVQAMNEAFLTTQDMPTVEHGILRADGSERVVEVTGLLAETDDDGVPTRVIGSVLDVTERTKREAELRESKIALEQAQAITHTGNGIWDRATNAFTMSEEAGHLLGLDPSRSYTPDALIVAIHPDDRTLVAEVFDRLRRGEGHDIEYRVRAGDGTPRWIRSRARPEVDADGEVVRAIGTITDVTREKRRREELVAAKEAAEEANRLKTAFLANMSHEIRTPLTSIIGFLEMMQEMDLPAPADRFTQIVHGSSRRLLATLTSVLDLSQLEAGALDLTLTPVSLAAAAQQGGDEWAARAQAAGVALHVDAPDVPPATILADDDALHSVVTNLLSNALKFTGAGGRVDVTVTVDAEEAVLVVADTGVGIGAEFLDDIFDAFRQESTGDAREFEGSGLGLTITKRYVDLFGGTIALDSTKGEGTRVTARFPRA